MPIEATTQLSPFSHTLTTYLRQLKEFVQAQFLCSWRDGGPVGADAHFIVSSSYVVKDVYTPRNIAGSGILTFIIAFDNSWPHFYS